MVGGGIALAWGMMRCTKAGGIIVRAGIHPALAEETPGWLACAAAGACMISLGGCVGTVATLGTGMEC